MSFFGWQFVNGGVGGCDGDDFCLLSDENFQYDGEDDCEGVLGQIDYEFFDGYVVFGDWMLLCFWWVKSLFMLVGFNKG